jgi:hypothetical protein
MGAAFAIRTWQPRSKPCAAPGEDCRRGPLWELFSRPLEAPAGEDRPGCVAAEEICRARGEQTAISGFAAGTPGLLTLRDAEARRGGAGCVSRDPRTGTHR